MNRIANSIPAASNARELLTAVISLPFDPNKETLEKLIPEADWDAVLALARRHRLVPLLFSRLRESRLSVPAAIGEMLRAEYERNAFHSIANARELICILGKFAELKISAMPFKGVVLATSVYKDLTTRPAGDLDLLIFERDLRDASAALISQGYRLTTEIHEDGSPAVENYYEYHFERSADGMVVELRWRLELTQPKFRHNLGMEWLWPKRHTTKLAGVEVPDMDPESALLVLCMHGSKHVWSRLIWVCDVARLISAHTSLDWHAARREAKRVGLWRCVALGSLLAHRICGAYLPARILRDFESDTRARKLADYFQKHIFDHHEAPPEGRIPYNIQLLGMRDRLRLFFSIELLRPNARDRAAIRLPRALHFLYYLVRPVRLLLDRSAR